MLESMSELIREQPGATRHALDEVPAGLARFDADGHLLACNAELRRILGTVPERADALVLRPLFTTADRMREVKPPLARALAGESVHGEEYELQREGDTARCVRVSAAPADAEVGGAWLLMVDVGERRSLDILRDQVLGVVAHDLRNPMSAMRMTLAMLGKKTELPMERRLALTERLTGTLGRMEALVNTLAEFARADGGIDVRLQLAPGNLGLLYDRLQPDLDVIYPGRKVEVQRLGDLEGEWDAARIERVLAHLVGNALKHGADDAPVTLALDGTAAEHLRITVRNQGPPIPADLLPQVYQPFTTGSIDKNGRRRGIGLGLFVVRHLVEAHGGTVQLTSTAEAGTQVTVNLPRRTSAARPEQDRAPDRE
jgi:signal transduction histidine kinase